MLFVLSTTYLASFPMGWEFCSIAVSVILIWAMVFCADCFGRLFASRTDTSDTNSQRSAPILYDITAPDTVDLNEYDILNNDGFPDYESRDQVDHQPCPRHRSSPIPIPPRHTVPIDKYRYVAYSNATTACADDIYRKENIVSSDGIPL